MLTNCSRNMEWAPLGNSQDSFRWQAAGKWFHPWQRLPMAHRGHWCSLVMYLGDGFFLDFWLHVQGCEELQVQSLPLAVLPRWSQVCSPPAQPSALPAALSQPGCVHWRRLNSLTFKRFPIWSSKVDIGSSKLYFSSKLCLNRSSCKWR